MSGDEVDDPGFSMHVDDAGVAHVVFGAPGAMPALGAAGHAAIAALWPRLAADPAVRVVLLRSAGRGFCAGGTVDSVAAMVRDEGTRLRVLEEARALVQGMIDCDKPIVSAINGAAVGAGAALALLADVSIAARGAKIIDGHTKLGVAAGDHAAVIWPLLCGVAKAKYLLLLCEPVTGEEAERIGLVSLAVPAEELEARALEVARRLAAGSAQALAFTKRTINHWLRAAWPAFEHSLALEILGFAGADAREGVTAMQQKRAPVFAR